MTIYDEEPEEREGSEVPEPSEVVDDVEEGPIPPGPVSSVGRLEEPDEEESTDDEERRPDDEERHPDDEEGGDWGGVAVVVGLIVAAVAVLGGRQESQSHTFR